MTNELDISFHIANKRSEKTMPVSKFVNTEMIYLVDPKIVFDLGQQFGMHSEKLLKIKKDKNNLKQKASIILKRVFIDE